LAISVCLSFYVHAAAAVLFRVDWTSPDC
jgi:hypothetical protein